jgi:VWFA-related protein
MKRLWAQAWIVVLLITLATQTNNTALFAQQGTPQVPGPTIRVNTRLVLVDVVVTDKQGHAVTGLKADNFVVEENGKKQKVTTFVTPEDAANAAGTPVLAPGLYSNRPEFRSSGGPLTILLADAANTPFQDQSYARLQMLAYVRSQLKPDQRIAVFTLTNELHMLQDFTSDPQILLAALEKIKPEQPILMNAAAPAASSLAAAPGPGSALANQISMAQAEISGFQSEQVGFALDRRVQITLSAMRALGRALGGIPGRKEVIWLTAAFPFELIPENRDMSDAELVAAIPTIAAKGLGTTSAGNVAEAQRQAYAPEIRQAAAEMSASQVAIYPVDVRGLMSGMEGAAAALPPHGANASFDPVAGMQDITASQDTMREIAKETGGRAYVNQNDIKSGVAAALADNSAAYTLGYYPENKKWDSRYRTIKVKLDREGVQVQHRRGYYAIDPGQIKNRKPEQDVAEAIHGAAPATLVTFSARAKRNDKGNLHVDFLVDAASVTAGDSSGGAKRLNVNLYVAVFSGEGKIIANHSLKVDQELKPEVYQQVLQRGMLVPMDLDIAPPTNAQLRLAVRDERTGFIGTAGGPLVIQ